MKRLAFAKLRLALALSLPVALGGAIATPTTSQVAGSSTPLTVRADVQEADARTGIVTARGNVQINYPARDIQATSNQAQYFSNERRLVLTGNVYVLQEGNSIRGEVVTYLIDEGLFVAQPLPNRQVESIYLIPENTQPDRPSAPAAPPIQ
ncbi:LptA/OstA family protein [Geitlerinema sp. CS-897]|uniref:LptA/OstA family protein n=1 Tax=Baaleninema simplex TaxID=2862350 RepID=UPI00037E9F23|nr:LptA/OstA family protein [Baaleninema simplex]MDC0831402.1 LptA/OstA family protein [Geitlerinema sp. CS-897]